MNLYKWTSYKWTYLQNRDVGITPLMITVGIRGVGWEAGIDICSPAMYKIDN